MATAEMTIDNIYNNILSTKKQDYVAPRSKITLEREKEDILMVNMGGEYRFPMTEHANGQLDASIAPGFITYSRWLREKGDFDTYVHNVNKALGSDAKKAQIRTVERESGGVARAVLSDMFKSIDDDIVFGTAIPAISEHSDRFKAIGGNRTDIKTYLKVVTRNPVFSIETGGKKRDFSAGFIMSNSEVGMGYCEFLAFFTDNYCNNGCIFSKSVIANVKYAHRGTRISTDFGLIMGDRVKTAEMESIRGVILDASNIACSFGGYEPIMEMIKTSAMKKISGGNHSAVIEAVSENLGLTKDECEKVKCHYDNDSGSMFAIQAAITRLAQDSGSYDRKVQLEIAGGNLLSMPDRQWSALASLA
jgi:hypothetical protein